MHLCLHNHCKTEDIFIAHCEFKLFFPPFLLNYLAVPGRFPGIITCVTWTSVFKTESNYLQQVLENSWLLKRLYALKHFIVGSEGMHEHRNQNKKPQSRNVNHVVVCLHSVVSSCQIPHPLTTAFLYAEQNYDLRIILSSDMAIIISISNGAE